MRRVGFPSSGFRSLSARLRPITWTTAILVLVAALGALLPATPAAAAATSPQTATDCPDAAFIGVYGTGESPGNSDVINKTYQAFSQSYHGGRAKEVDFNYGSIHVSDYLNPNDIAKAEREVSEGASKLDDTFTDYFGCANTTFYLAGYSAGAWIIDKFLASIGTKVLDRVSGVVVYGDPQDRESAASGIARQFPPTAVDPMPTGQLGADRVRSYCLDGDPICGGQWVLDNRVRAASGANCALEAQGQPTPVPCTHFDYTREKTREGGQFLASLSRGS